MAPVAETQTPGPRAVFAVVVTEPVHGLTKIVDEVVYETQQIAEDVARTTKYPDSVESTDDEGRLMFVAATGHTVSVVDLAIVGDPFHTSTEGGAE